MNKIIFILTIAILIMPAYSWAQTPGTEEEADDSEINIKVDQIKDKVASRVAELNLVEKRGVVGVVERVDDNEIRINDLNDKTRIIEVDELTKFSSEEGSIDITDLKKGTKISAIGLYNKDSEKLLARFINEISIPLFLNGVISSKDDKNFTITLSTEGEKDYLVDVENITKTFTFTDGQLETIGFTKLPVMKNALIIGYEDPKNPDRITANRIIIFPDVPKNPRVEVENAITSPSKSPTISPIPTDEE